MTMTRREFLQYSAGAALALSAGSTCLCGCKTLQGRSDVPIAPQGSFRFEGGTLILDLAQTPSLTPIGGAVIIKSALRDSIIVVQESEGVFYALANKCSHRSKELDYQAAQNRLRCASLGHSTFDLKGNVLSGPAKKPIPSYPVTQNGNLLRIDISGIV